jgi:hypothetical protein
MPVGSEYSSPYANSEHPGGHLKPDPLLRAASVLEVHGRAIAEHVASFEARQVDAIRDLVQREHVDCDFEETKVIDVCLYEEGREKIKTDLAKITKADISTAKEIAYSSGSEAEVVCMHFRHDIQSLSRLFPLLP